MIGRKHGTILKEQRTLYLDIYNPRLADVHSVTTTKTPPEHARHYHINRGVVLPYRCDSSQLEADELIIAGYGVMLRQAWPYGTPQQCGMWGKEKKVIPPTH